MLRVGLLAVVALIATLLLAGTARAGGGSFDNFAGGDAADPRATVFGFVKDRAGDPVEGARVTITMTKLNADVVVQSDPQGHYTAKLFYKPIDPKDVALACAKEGFHQMVAVKRPLLAAGAPIEIDCVLQRN